MPRIDNLLYRRRCETLNKAACRVGITGAARIFGVSRGTIYRASEHIESEEAHVARLNEELDWLKREQYILWRLLDSKKASNDQTANNTR